MVVEQCAWPNFISGRSGWYVQKLFQTEGNVQNQWTKIFISGRRNILTENIIHLVLPITLPEQGRTSLVCSFDDTTDPADHATSRRGDPNL